MVSLKSLAIFVAMLTILDSVTSYPAAPWLGGDKNSWTPPHFFGQHHHRHHRQRLPRPHPSVDGDETRSPPIDGGDDQAWGRANPIDGSDEGTWGPRSPVDGSSEESWSPYASSSRDGSDEGTWGPRSPIDGSDEDTWGPRTYPRDDDDPISYGPGSGNAYVTDGGNSESWAPGGGSGGGGGGSGGGRQHHKHHILGGDSSSWTPRQVDRSSDDPWASDSFGWGGPDTSSHGRRRHLSRRRPVSK